MFATAPTRPARRARRAAAVAAGLAVAAVAAGCSGKEEAAQPPTVTITQPVVAAPTRLVHVDARASRRGDGTRARPYRTIQRALAELGAGVAVVVHEGVYDEHLVLRRGGTARAPAVLRAGAGERVEIRGRLKIVADNAAVTGIVFTGGDGASEDVLVYVAGAENVTLRRLEVREARLSGIFVGERSSRVRIAASWIHDNGTDAGLDHGIYLERTSGGTVSDNLIEGNVGYGLQLYPDADGFIVTHNTIVGNGRSGIVVGGELATSDANVIANNIAAFNAELGIRTFWGGNVGIGNRLFANLAYANPQGNVSVDGAEASDTVVEDPRFVGPGLDDYRLDEGSAAIDRADPAYGTPRDFDGVARPQGDGPDIGALERPAG